ncbi:Uncharacterized conserved protein YecE, DUF72 family [Oceanospirillum multiglobuliferum]|uniref:DUF72 domain-containing protein n=1 Tax=Oceanospirillum multiglobuliferum TaxID=64969 RepID=A0A1T4M728_9GAMM|nr:DUF72 domain-containing protein [Oceanospirillum multiglobuliferum]OPX56222.1 hypothetical protein BTE48_04395 [Oceanospirillum multiglobuliferum]SJZ62722.1 Uncharacterized conserved protein YecE, DUF72 family [Oceanospirillum multiglobuliferum]
MTSTRCYVGLSQWNHKHWQQTVLSGNGSLSPLFRYSRWFSSVEGNTSFYGLPEAQTIKDWYEQTPEHFRFCFKLPRTITHDRKLQVSHQELLTTLERFALLKEKLGMIFLQLPDSFGPEQLPVLDHFLRGLPEEMRFSLEVRHRGFFNKDESERQLNSLLIELGINRTMFDTRALFQHPAPDADTQEALKAKPNLPLHVIATGQNPMVRFITAKDWQGTLYCLEPWIVKISQWLQEGRSPYVFLHTPRTVMPQKWPLILSSN